MNTYSRLLIATASVLAPAWVALAAVSAADDAPVAGRILVLQNERTLEGDIERHGSSYRIRRGTGEMWVQSDQVLKLCSDKEDAYRYLRARANLRDADEHVRLAKWCHQQGMRDQSLAEVQEAADIRPEHAETQRLLRSLQRSQVLKPVPGAPVKQEEPEAMLAPPPLVDTEAVSTFLTRVQPTLMNTCASCHATGKGGSFKLTRVYSGVNQRRTTQSNLASVLQQIAYDRPGNSPLLTKAVTIHGGMTQAPLKNRDLPAFRTLEDWIARTLIGNPHLVEQALVSSGKVGAQTETPTATAFAETTAKASTDALKPPAATDAFDPALFNRQMHPDKKPETKTGNK